jgi:hypothetical protein
MSSITKRVFYSNSSWVDRVEHVSETGVLTIFTDEGKQISYQVPESKFFALEARCAEKRNKNGDISVGSAVNEFIGANCDFNIDGAQKAAAIAVANMSALERQSTWIALCNTPNLFDPD